MSDKNRITEQDYRKRFTDDASCKTENEVNAPYVSGRKRGKKLRPAFLARMLMSVLAALVLAAGFAGCGHTASAASEPDKTPDQLTNAKLPLEFVDTIDLKSHALMALSDPGYGATQGMCVAEDRYLIVGRYRSDGAKDLMVYDVMERKVKASNVFRKSSPEAPDFGTDVDLDHINGLTYYDGYLYIPRSQYRDIIRLKMNEDCSVVFDSVVFTAQEGEAVPANISCHNGVFYWMASGRSGGKFAVYCSTDGFQNTRLAFKSDVGGLAAQNLLAKQGMSFDGEHLYFAFSGRLIIPALENETDWQKLVRNTEKIVITDLDGEIIKTLTFSRGSYGEIEDVDTIQLGGSTYLVISNNQNDNGVSSVYALPLFRNTVPSGYLEASGMDGSFYFDKREFKVYCDNTPCYPDGEYDSLKSNPFASGLIQDRFTSVYAAVDYIKRLGCPAKLYLTGDYADLVFYNLPAGIGFVLDEAEVSSLRFVQCPGITLEGQNKAVLGGLKAEKSVVLAAPGISLVRRANGQAYGIEAKYSVLTGSFSEMTGFRDNINEVQSVVSVSYAGGEKSAGAGAAAENNAGQTEEETSVLRLSYYDQQIVSTLAKHGKNVMLTLTLHNVDPGEGNSTVYPGVVPNEFRPAADVVFPAVIAESETGADPIGMCSLHIAADGTITVYGGAEGIDPSSYILVTAAYLAA